MRTNKKSKSNKLSKAQLLEIDQSLEKEDNSVRRLNIIISYLKPTGKKFHEEYRGKWMNKVEADIISYCQNADDNETAFCAMQILLDIHAWKILEIVWEKINFRQRVEAYILGKTFVERMNFFYLVAGLGNYPIFELIWKKDCSSGNVFSLSHFLSFLPDTLEEDVEIISQLSKRNAEKVFHRVCEVRSGLPERIRNMLSASQTLKEEKLKLVKKLFRFLSIRKFGLNRNNRMPESLCFIFDAINVIDFFKLLERTFSTEKADRYVHCIMPYLNQKIQQLEIEKNKKEIDLSLLGKVSSFSIIEEKIKQIYCETLRMPFSMSRQGIADFINKGNFVPFEEKVWFCNSILNILISQKIGGLHKVMPFLALIESMELLKAMRTQQAAEQRVKGCVGVGERCLNTRALELERVLKEDGKNSGTACFFQPHKEPTLNELSTLTTTVDDPLESYENSDEYSECRFWGNWR